jgi:hypothetical protein
MADKHYTHPKDGMHRVYREQQRDLRSKQIRAPLPPKLSPLDEELIANLEAEVFDHEPDCICDFCFDLRVLKMTE